jgi:hypothetical protein
MKTRRQGDREKERRGNVEAGRFDFSFSLSPLLLVPSSLLLSVTPCLCGMAVLLK